MIERPKQITPGRQRERRAPGTTDNRKVPIRKDVEMVLATSCASRFPRSRGAQSARVRARTAVDHSRVRGHGAKRRPEREVYRGSRST